eukprot:1648577-Rhodomonas_salina.1
MPRYLASAVTVPHTVQELSSAEGCTGGLRVLRMDHEMSTTLVHTTSGSWLGPGAAKRVPTVAS